MFYIASAASFSSMSAIYRPVLFIYIYMSYMVNLYKSQSINLYLRNRLRLV